MSRSPLARCVIAASCVVALLSACSPLDSTAATARAQAPADSSQASPGADVRTPVAPDAAPAPLVRNLPDFTALVARFGPAVVNVSVVAKRQQTGGAPGLSPDDPFYDFFRRFGIPQPRGGNAPPVRGEGSGFVVSPDGYILTNAHVVDEAGQVTVRFTDRREYTAKVVGFDRQTDIAVLKIDASNLPTVRIGNAESLRPGEWVVAIGSPFGFENSVTAGVVSAVARPLPGGDSNYVRFIQTDVAVNPGNSGGPLFNMSGEVVGINSQIYSRTGGFMGISFAIPIDLAVNIKDQIVKTGRVSRGKIGVSIQEVNAQFAESFGLDRPRGALVGSVETGGPADRAGLKAGDIILSANGRAVERSTDLPPLIAAVRPGTDTQLEVWRDRNIRRVTVRVAELEERTQRMANRAGGEQRPQSNRLGLVVRELSAEERRQAGTSGAVVVESAEGAAADADIRPGDIILGVNGRSVKTARELEEAAKSARQTVALLIQRDDAQIFVPVRIE